MEDENSLYNCNLGSPSDYPAVFLSTVLAKGFKPDDFAFVKVFCQLPKPTRQWV